MIKPKTIDLSFEAQNLRSSEMEQYDPYHAPERWATRQEAAIALGVVERTVDRYRTAGMLGYYRGPVPGFDAAVRFWRPDIEQLRAEQEPTG